MAKSIRNAWWLKANFWILEDSDNPEKSFAVYYWTTPEYDAVEKMVRVSANFDTYEAAKTYWKLTHG